MRVLVSLLSVMSLFLVGCEPDDQPMQNASPESGSLVFSQDGETAFIASADHHSVLVVDAQSRELLTEVSIGQSPEHLLVWDDDILLATTRFGHTLERISQSSANVTESMTVGTEPMGMAVWDEAHVAIALAGEQAVAVVHVETMQTIHRIALPDADPRAVAKVGDTTIVVSHMTAGVLTEIETTTLRVNSIVAHTVNNFGPPLHANHLRSLTVDQVQGTVLVAHSQSNPTPIRSAAFGIDPNEEDMDRTEEQEREDFGDGACGYSGCFGELGAVSAAVTEIDTQRGNVLVPMFEENEDNNNDCGMFGNCSFEMPRQNPPSVFNPFEQRFGGLAMNNPVAMALVSDGQAMLVVNQGSHNALLLRRNLTGELDDVIGFYRIGAGATGIAVHPQGEEAWVWNQFDGTVSVIPLPTVTGSRTINQQSRFGAGNFSWPWQVDDQRDEFRQTNLAEYRVQTVSLKDDELDDADASIGRRLFHDATNQSISLGGTIACSSCHPDGRTDGQTWQFDFGPRNTPQLGGEIMDTAPFHWPGDVTTHRDLNTNTILAFMGGHGLPDEDMDHLGTFMDTIPAPPTVALQTKVLTESEERGRTVFYREDVQCGTCHLGGDYTDNLNWNIGSQSDSRDIQEFQTPVLHGLSRSAPYLHDGSSPTLEHFVETWVHSNRMGRGSHLTDEETQDLIAFLKTL